MNISQVLRPAQQFISKNLATGDDFGSVKAGREEATRVDTEVGRIHADTVDVRGELENLQENSKLKPPTFADISNKQVMLGTTSAGAVVGGALGALSNLASGSSGQVTFNERIVDINQPKLDGLGFDTKYYTVGGTPQNPESWDVDISRRAIVHEKVGEYTERTPNVSGSGNIALSGLIGVGIGTGVGALAGGAIVGLRKVLNKEYNGTPPRQTEGDNKILIAGGVAGATIGGIAGGLSSVINSGSVSYETQSIPAMETKVIGEVPSGGGFNIPNDGELGPPANTEQVADWMNGNIDKLARKGFRGTENLRPEKIEAQVPQRNILGKVKIDTETKEVNVGAGLVSSVVGGMAVGAVTGVAGGVLVNVLRKSL